MNLPRYTPDPTQATRYLFFTGKGGVGKTSLSSATALRLADHGKRVLLVSTDPASNLDEVLETSLGEGPTSIPGANGLYALNIDPLRAAAAYRERLTGPLRGLLPESALRSMEEQLSGACTVEIATFDLFSGWIGDSTSSAGWDHIVFDTAPTGHTLRLMGLARAWDRFLASSTSGTSCLGPLAGLQKQRAVYQRTVDTLAKGSESTLFLVSRPHGSALNEARRTSVELRALGIENQRLILNGVFESGTDADPVAEAFQRRGESACAAAASFIQSLPSTTVALRSINILGVSGLRRMLADDADGADDLEPCNPVVPSALPDMETLESLVASLEKEGHGVIMTMGKGGVGKTTIASAIAVMLAHRGHRVHLSTTDPAAHIAETVVGNVAGLTSSRIDPVLETAAYREEVLGRHREDLDENSVALLEEDLRSPCTEEIAVFRAFAREVAKGVDRFVVLDTAPTGHTLLLLDASEAYNRELARQTRTRQPESVTTLLARLRDPAYTRVLVTVIPEATPIHEAASLQEDLRRAGIEPFAWVINQSWIQSGSADRLLRLRAARELPYLTEVAEKHSKRVICLPWQQEEPIGPNALMQLATAHVLHSRAT